jgi:capsid protein
MTDQHSEFAQDMLSRIAGSIGVSYEMLSEDYDRTHRHSFLNDGRVYRRWEVERQRAIQEWFRPVLWQITWQYHVPVIIGYDPQRLLT